MFSNRILFFAAMLISSVLGMEFEPPVIEINDSNELQWCKTGLLGMLDRQMMRCKGKSNEHYVKIPESCVSFYAAENLATVIADKVPIDDIKAFTEKLRDPLLQILKPWETMMVVADDNMKDKFIANGTCAFQVHSGKKKTNNRKGGTRCNENHRKASRVSTRKKANV